MSSLFLVLAANVGSLPLSKTKRTKVGKDLVAFGEEIDTYLRAEEGGTTRVRKYAAAVERAASDLNNRLSRDAVLRDLLAEAW